jgi:hypothetical protein
MFRSATRSYSRTRQRGISRKDGYGMSPLTTVDLKPTGSAITDSQDDTIRSVLTYPCTTLFAICLLIHEVLLSFTRVMCTVESLSILRRDIVVLYNLVKMYGRSTRYGRGPSVMISSLLCTGLARQCERHELPGGTALVLNKANRVRCTRTFEF